MYIININKSSNSSRFVKLTNAKVYHDKAEYNFHVFLKTNSNIISFNYLSLLIFYLPHSHSELRNNSEQFSYLLKYCSIYFFQLSSSIPIILPPNKLHIRFIDNIYK